MAIPLNVASLTTGTAAAHLTDCRIGAVLLVVARFTTLVAHNLPTALPRAVAQLVAVEAHHRGAAACHVALAGAAALQVLWRQAAQASRNQALRDGVVRRLAQIAAQRCSCTADWCDVAPLAAPGAWAVRVHWAEELVVPRTTQLTGGGVWAALWPVVGGLLSMTDPATRCWAIHGAVGPLAHGAEMQ